MIRRLIVHVTEALEQSLELVQRVEREGEPAASLDGLEVDAGLGADALGDAAFEPDYVGVTAVVGRILVGRRTLHATDVFLELAHGQAFTQGLLGQ